MHEYLRKVVDLEKGPALIGSISKDLIAVRI